MKTMGNKNEKNENPQVLVLGKKKNYQTKNGINNNARKPSIDVGIDENNKANGDVSDNSDNYLVSIL